MRKRILLYDCEAGWTDKDGQRITTDLGYFAEIVTNILQSEGHEVIKIRRDQIYDSLEGIDGVAAHTSDLSELVYDINRGKETNIRGELGEFFKSANSQEDAVRSSQRRKEPVPTCELQVPTVLYSGGYTGITHSGDLTLYSKTELVRNEVEAFKARFR